MWIVEKPQAAGSSLSVKGPEPWRSDVRISSALGRAVAELTNLALSCAENGMSEGSFSHPAAAQWPKPRTCSGRIAREVCGPVQLRTCSGRTPREVLHTCSVTRLFKQNSIRQNSGKGPARSGERKRLSLRAAGGVLLLAWSALLGNLMCSTWSPLRFDRFSPISQIEGRHRVCTPPSALETPTPAACEILGPGTPNTASASWLLEGPERA